MNRRRQPAPMSLLPWNTDVGAHHRRGAEACDKPIGRKTRSRPVVLPRFDDASLVHRVAALQHEVAGIAAAVRRIGQDVTGERDHRADDREILERVERRLAVVARNAGVLEVPTAPTFNGRKSWDQA